MDTIFLHFHFTIKIQYPLMNHYKASKADLEETFKNQKYSERCWSSSGEIRKSYETQHDVNQTGNNTV